MRHFTAPEISSALTHPHLMAALEQAFRDGGEAPLRHVHPVATADGGENTLLLMPCWQAGGYLGTKIVMVCPGNDRRGLGAVQASYLLMNAETGVPLAALDGHELTVRRTAAASALASRYLSRPDSHRLLVVGTGNLAPHLIAGHAAARPIREVRVWGRSHAKAVRLAEKIARESGLDVRATDDLDGSVPWADIITSATLSREPLVLGRHLRPGQHLDLVGAYRPDMRESDDAAVARARVYLDTRAGALAEAGDILQPLRSGAIAEAHVQGDLFDLVAGRTGGRRAENDITLFKSVGAALEDLAAARLVYEHFTA